MKIVGEGTSANEARVLRVLSKKCPAVFPELVDAGSLEQDLAHSLGLSRASEYLVMEKLGPSLYDIAKGQEYCVFRKTEIFSFGIMLI